MSLVMKSQFASPEPMRNSQAEAHAAATGGSSPSTITAISVKLVSSELASKHTDFDDFMAELEADPANAQGLAEAGSWVADQFYADDGITLRTARLRKGFSQKQLAEILGTSQPHVATIEKAGGDFMFATAAKLCEALGITLNDLPAILQRQRDINASKEKK